MDISKAATAVVAEFNQICVDGKLQQELDNYPKPSKLDTTSQIAYGDKWEDIIRRIINRRYPNRTDSEHHLLMERSCVIAKDMGIGTKNDW